MTFIIIGYSFVLLDVFDLGGYPKDQASALKYFSKACELDNAIGCDFAGKLLTNCEPSIPASMPRDNKLGMQYLERGCNLKDTSNKYESSECCYSAAFFYDFGLDGIEKNVEKAIEYGIKACKLDNVKACKLVSELYNDLGKDKESELFYRRYRMFKKQMSI